MRRTFVFSVTSFEMADIQERLAQTRREIEQIKEEIKSAKESKNDTSLREFAKGVPQIQKFTQLKARRTLKGHLGKVYALHWSEDSQHLVSASQDGKLLVWDGVSTNKVYAIPLRSSWVSIGVCRRISLFTKLG